MSRELKASDIAERRGISRITAYRWLVELEKRYGPSVVGRRGKRGILFTTEEAFAKVAPAVTERYVGERRMQDLEDRMGDAERRADRHIQSILNVEARVAKLEDNLNLRKI